MSARLILIHGHDDPSHKVRPILEIFRARCKTVIVPSRDICFDELAIQYHHRAFSRLIYRKMHKHTSVGFKIWAICCPDGYIVDFEPAVVRNRELAPRAAFLSLFCELPHSNYCLFADNLFVNIATITECYNLLQSVFLSGTVSKNCTGFLKALLNHSMKGSKILNLQHAEYEAMPNDGLPQTVAVVWCHIEETKFLGSGSGSDEATLFQRKHSTGTEAGHGKRRILAPRIAVDYNLSMRGVYNCDHLKNVRTVRRRSAKPHITLFFWILDSALMNA